MLLFFSFSKMWFHVLFVSGEELCFFLVCFSLQVAIIAGNFELAELIKNHKETDIGE